MNQDLKILESINTEYGKLSFRLVRSYRRRTVAIYVNENADVSVFAPFFVRRDMIFDFIREKSLWIVKKIAQVKRNRSILEERRFDTGSMFLFLGNKYPLIIETDEKVRRVRIDFDGASWKIKLPLVDTLRKSPENIIKKKLIEWYKRQAKEMLPGRVFYYSRVVGVEPSNIAVKTQKRLWGNCDYAAKIIRLNWQIILAPIEVIDYVVVHEICHLIFPNHSKNFWHKVGEILPKYKENRKWLREHYSDMAIL